MAELAQPAAIHWIDGSDAENEYLCKQLVEAGTFTKLNEKLWPGCYYARSSANGARVMCPSASLPISVRNVGSVQPAFCAMRSLGL